MIIKSNQGFSLPELLVSLSIIAMIMSTVLYNYGGFNDKLALSAGAQEIAIAVRQAQTYGLTVKEVSVTTGSFSSAYGVYFDYVTEPANYYIFADANGNRKYDLGSGCGSGPTLTECIEKFTLRNGVRVTSICDTNSVCPATNSQKLHITFLRPNPDATIIFANSSNVTQGISPLTGKVRLTSGKGVTLTVTVESTGQVSVQ
ncbi:MAG: type II secretion system protein [Candidatus Zambryskibacteria bacterium]|nr:type II secretion system protein [Candidatus Zambryskibacteria bacterium]